MLFLGKKPEWAVAKGEMQNAQEFLKVLKSVADNISKLKEKQLKEIRSKYVEKDWNIETIKKTSEPAADLAAWAKALSEYQKAFKIIEPKRKAKDEATAKVNVLQIDLNKKLEAVRVVQEKVAYLEKEEAKL